MASPNTLTFRRATRDYSKRARLLITHGEGPTPSIFRSTVTDSHKEPFLIHKDGSLRRVAPKEPSRRDKIRAFGKYMGRP